MHKIILFLTDRLGLNITNIYLKEQLLFMCVSHKYDVEALFSFSQINPDSGSHT